MSPQVKNRRKLNVNSIRKMKNSEKIVMVTAYDALFAKIFNDDVAL